MKNVLLTLSILSSTVVLPSTHLNVSITATKAGESVQTETQTIVLDEQNHGLIEAGKYTANITAQPDENDVHINAVITQVDDNGDSVVVSEPVLVAQWGTESKLELADAEGNTFQIVVVPSQE